MGCIHHGYQAHRLYVQWYRQAVEKLRVKAHIAKMEREAGNIMILIAHRRELIGQISMALAQEGIMHQLICANSARTYISTCHVNQLGRSYYSPEERIL